MLARLNKKVDEGLEKLNNAKPYEKQRKDKIMVLFEKDVLLQQLLEGKLKDEQTNLLYSLNCERTVVLKSIAEAISPLREARDLLEMKVKGYKEEYVLDKDSCIKTLTKMSIAEEELEMIFGVMVNLFNDDFEEKSEERSL